MKRNAKIDIFEDTNYEGGLILSTIINNVREKRIYYGWDKSDAKRDFRSEMRKVIEENNVFTNQDI